MKVRIGIDVGGTFTDGVALSNDDESIIGKVKVPTTHTHENGVAEGIVMCLRKLMEDYQIRGEDIVFIAHGTTQATNALLEGDVCEVGVIATATGIETIKTKTDTKIENIELAPNKFIKTHHYFIESTKLKEELPLALETLIKSGSQVIIAAEPYSVDNNTNEKYIQLRAEEYGIPSTATHEISSLYGLKLRTRTSVINGSILPKMIETSNMTEQSVKKAGIDAQLMIMRCDGGVMSIDEVRSRPIMTLLSGPAAGVAGALMYERISDGLFLEVGGTSTDISAIKNGEVMLKYAEVGGHKTYVNSLDVRTLGIAGGSMIKVTGNEIVDVGPRSAHIAGFAYEAFANLDDIVNPELKFIQDGTDNYVYIACQTGKNYALTLTGAANILQLIPEDGYSQGNYDSSRKAYEVLAKYIGKSVLETAELVMEYATKKCVSVLDTLIHEYDLDRNVIELVGGGGGAGSIVPYISKKMKLASRLAKHAEVISTIGVALAMVREVVERSISNPNEDEVMKIRKEAENKIVKSGANPKTVAIKIEIDKKNNLLRAVATGSSELKKKERSKSIKTIAELAEIAAISMDVSINEVYEISNNDTVYVFEAKETKKSAFGLLKKIIRHQRILTNEGVIKLKLKNMDAVNCTVDRLETVMHTQLEKRTRYTDGGEDVPYVYVLCDSRIIDLTGLVDRPQIESVLKLEIINYENDQKCILLFGMK